MLLALAELALPAAAAAQAKPIPTIRDAGLIGVASALYLTPHVFAIAPPPSVCAPCSRVGVPGFDRWAIVDPRAAWANASTVAEIGLGAVLTVDLARTRAGGPHVLALVESTALAVGTTELLKAVVGRRRPVLYTAEAPDAVANPDSRRSLPSGHAAGAFAMATSYWFSRRALHGTRDAWAWVPLLVATGIGVMRVSAGRHFPSDVLIGAAVGIASATGVTAIRF